MPKLKGESLLTVAELAKKLSASRAWVYVAVEVGVKVNGSTTRVSLPHYRIGKHLRFDFKEVRAFLKSDGRG